MRRSDVENGLFDSIYADSGRYSFAPKKLLKALLLLILFSICRIRISGFFVVSLDHYQKEFP